MSLEKNKLELILKYIQDKLTLQEKMTLFDLTLADSKYRDELKEELKLAGIIKDSSVMLDNEVRDRIYSNVRLKAARESLTEEKVEGLLTNWLFDLSMPRITLPILNLFKRR